MEFLEPRGRRFEEALEGFLEGKGMVYRGVNFWLAPDGYLEVRVHPDWRVDPDDNQRSLDDLCFARCVEAEISSSSKRFTSATDDLPWRVIKLDEGGSRAVCFHCPGEDKVMWPLGTGWCEELYRSRASGGRSAG